MLPGAYAQGYADDVWILMNYDRDCLTPLKQCANLSVDKPMRFTCLW